ncbi:MAG: CAP domain-containing protein [Actinobacteria bacterium]|nr:CAP domain-containing protein [Actinomycetota bacterium]
MKRFAAVLATLAVLGLGAGPATPAHVVAPRPVPSPTPAREDFWARFLAEVEIVKVPPPKPEPDPAAARRIFDMSNRERRLRHIPELTWWPAALKPAARAQTDRMVYRQKLYHNPKLRSLLYSLHIETIGENVGVGLSIDGIQKAFMRSREHRENILDREYSLCAVWVVREPGSRMWVTVVFGTAL